MKLIIYSDTNEVMDVINVVNPIVDKNNVFWIGGSLEGIKRSFIIVDDRAVIGDTVTDELLQLDRKMDFTKVDLVEENRILKEKLITMEEKANFHESILVEIATMIYS